jgi:hypothetical protein
MNINDVKGIKKACTETKRCSKYGTYGAVEIAINTKTMSLYATWRYSQNDYSVWYDDNIVNLFTTCYPMTMAEIKKAVIENYYEVEKYNFEN